MKIQRPAEEIEVCDTCHREAYLLTCLACGKRFCLTCQAIISGCWVKVRIGRCCRDREDVRVIVDQFAAQITPIIEARTAALGALEEIFDV